MLSWLWAGMILVALVFGILHSTLGAVSAAVMSGAETATNLAISLAGPMCLWCGVGELMRRSGLRDKLGRLLSPVLGRLFPKLQKNKDGFSALCANVTANLLGLGNAATPMGISACCAMGDGTGKATDEQCRLVVMNTASIQLLPTTVAALRAGLGCASPLDILPAVWITSLCSVAAGLVCCRLLPGRKRHDR